MEQGAAHKAAVIVTIAFGMLLWNGAVEAKETLFTLEEIPAQVLSDGEMAAVEGKLLDPVLGLLSPNGLFDLVQGLGNSGTLSNLDVLGMLLGNGGPAGTSSPAFIPVAGFNGFGGGIGPGGIPIFQ
jgi:hypothetical protein